MKNDRIRFITRTAMLLALTVVFQMVGRLIPNNNFVVGPLVNACLLVSTVLGGIWSGIIISVVSPFTSLINNHAPVAPALMLFAPVVAAGNAVLVLSFYFIKKYWVAWGEYTGILIGAVLKFFVLYSGIILFLRTFSFPKFAQTLIYLFGLPQLLTALAGGIIALVVLKPLKKIIGQGTYKNSENS